MVSLKDFKHLLSQMPGTTSGNSNLESMNTSGMADDEWEIVDVRRSFRVGIGLKLIHCIDIIGNSGHH